MGTPRYLGDDGRASEESVMSDALLARQILMDYCGAGSIKDLMRASGKPLTEEQIQYVLLNVLKALIYLHGLNIIHRGTLLVRSFDFYFRQS